MILRRLVGLGLLMFLLPLSAAAASPDVVTGLQAEYKNGQVEVQWIALPSEDRVAFYRVYWSFESILENDGLYDDFETTEGQETTFTLTDLPDYDVLYIGVTAVNIDGEDSNLFVEEVAVPLQETFSSSSSLSAEPEKTVPEELPLEGEEETPQMGQETLLLPGTDEETLPPETPDAGTTEEVISDVANQDAQTVSILSAIPMSPTSVLVTFSSPILVQPEDAPQSFSITDAFGRTLPIVRMRLDGTEAQITTLSQERGRVYELRMSEPAYSPLGLPLDPVNRTVFFDAHSESPEATSQEQPSVDATDVSAVSPTNGITNFQMQSSQQSNGLFMITATWEPQDQEIASYIVHQTRDSGQTFGAPQILAGTIGGVRIPDLTPGTFGLSLSIGHNDGTSYRAAYRNISLGRIDPLGSIPTTVPTLPASTVQPPVATNGNLSQVGGGLVTGSVLLSGAALGWLRSRRRKIV